MNWKRKFRELIEWIQRRRRVASRLAFMLLVPLLILWRLSIADDYRPAREKPSQQQNTPSPAIPDHTRAHAHDRSPQASVVDHRPVVEVHTLHDGKLESDPSHRSLCVGCDKFHEWHSTFHELYPIRFEVHAYQNTVQIPAEVIARDTGFPQFYWRTENKTGNQAGKKTGWAVAGWYGPEQFLQSYEKIVPHFQENLKRQIQEQEPERVAAAPANGAGKQAANGQDPTALFLKFAGPGKFSWKPDKPVAAYFDKTTFVQYTQITGVVSVKNGKPYVTFLDPKPQVSVRFGMWWNATLNGSTPDLRTNPPTAVIHTNRGDRVVTLPELPDFGSGDK